MTDTARDTTWRGRRQATGLSLSELARRAGLNKGTLSMIETGRMVPTPDEARLILRVIEEAGKPPDPEPAEAVA